MIFIELFLFEYFNFLTNFVIAIVFSLVDKRAGFLTRRGCWFESRLGNSFFS